MPSKASHVHSYAARQPPPSSSRLRGVQPARGPPGRETQATRSAVHFWSSGTSSHRTTGCRARVDGVTDLEFRPSAQSPGCGRAKAAVRRSGCRCSRARSECGSASRHRHRLSRRGWLPLDRSQRLVETTRELDGASPTRPRQPRCSAKRRRPHLDRHRRPGSTGYCIFRSARKLDSPSQRGRAVLTAKRLNRGELAPSDPAPDSLLRDR